VTPSAATFDPKKLEWMKGEHIRRLSINELVAAVLPFAVRATEIDSTYASRTAVELAQERAIDTRANRGTSRVLFVPDE